MKKWFKENWRIIVVYIFIVVIIGFQLAMGRPMKEILPPGLLAVVLAINFRKPPKK